MPPPEEASSSRVDHSSNTQLQEEYKRALVEVLREVMHPPELEMLSGWYAYCIEVNKLMRDLKSITSKLGAPSNVPPSFLDLHEFLEDAWHIAVTEVVPGFHDKWPHELDSMVEKSFQTGETLGRMRVVGEPKTAMSRSSAVGVVSPTGRRRVRGEERSIETAGSAPSVESSPAHFQSLQASPVSPSRRLSTAEFELLVKDPDTNNNRSQSYSQSISQNQTSDPASTISPSPVPRQLMLSAPTATNHHHVSSPRPGPIALVAERSASLRRSPSARPWIPPSYRDGSMPADLVELYERLDEACQCADTLILDAYSLDATDENESGMKLAEWTRSAKRCGASGREALHRIRAAGLSKTGEVLYVSSTLNLLRSAHVELVEYAALFHGPNGATQRPGVSGLDSAVSESADTPTRSTSSIASTHQDELPRAEDMTTKRKVVPYVMIPQVPWRWKPLQPKPRIRITANRTPGSSRVTLPLSPISSSGRPCKLERPTDRQPGDAEHDPPCSNCAERGLACFGQADRQNACRRCRRRARERCTYARRPGKGAQPQVQVKILSKSSPMKKTPVKAQANEAVRVKGKGKTVVDQKVVIGRKRKRPSLDTMKKLRSTDARREAWYAAEDKDGDSSDSSSSSSGTGSVPAPKRRRRRSMSLRPTHEPEECAHLPMRATSEPPERERASVASAARAQSRNRSRRPTFSTLGHSSRESTPVILGQDSPVGENGINGIVHDTTEPHEPPIQPRLLSTPSASPTPELEELPSITVVAPTLGSVRPASTTSTIIPTLNNSLLDALSIKLASLTTSHTSLTTELHHMRERHTAETKNIQTKIDAQEGAIAEVRKVMGMLRAQMMGITGEGEDEDEDEEKDDDTMYSPD